MTVTISRLYDNHSDAQQAVRRLEAAGVPHSDISLVANNSDGWFNTDKKVIATTMVSMIAQKELARAPASVPASVAQRAFLPGSACWRFLDLDPLLRPVGWPRRRLARPQAPRPAVLSVRSPRPAFRKRMLTPMPKASAEEARWCQRE